MHWDTIYVVIFMSEAHSYAFPVARSPSEYKMNRENPEKIDSHNLGAVNVSENFDKRIKKFSNSLPQVDFLIFLNAATIIEVLLTIYAYILS